MSSNKIDEAQWMAYVDGGLDAEGRALVEAAMAADPALASQVQAQQALRGRLQRGLAAELDEPLPARLSALFAQAEPTLATAGAAASGPPPSPDRRLWWFAGAGLLAGLLLPRLLPEQAADLRIDGQLAAALEQRLAADATAADGWRMTLSFRAKDGRYCRGFSGLEQAGLACKAGNGLWQLALLVPAAPQTGELRQAGSSLPPAVLEAIDTRLAGQTLDAAAEAEARKNGWR